MKSIEIKLPAAFALLLGLLVSLYVYAAYRGVEHSAMEAARDRVFRVNTELAQLQVAQNDRRAATFKTLGSSAAIQNALAGRPAGAAASLNSLRRGSDSTAILLLDSAFEIVASAGKPPSAVSMKQLRAIAQSFAESAGRLQTTPLFEDDDGVYHWSGALVEGRNGSPGFIAHLVRATNTDTTSSAALKQLMGDAMVYFKNASSDSIWITIDGKRAVAPQVDSTARNGLMHRRAEGLFVAHRSLVRNTPWMFVTEIPVNAARASALTFVRRTLPIALAIVLVGALLAWIIARRFQQTRQLNVELEERVRQRTAELEEVNRELQAFSYSVSHDLRSPLRTMDGFSQALLEDYGPSLDEEAQDYLTRIRNAAQHMGNLIDDLLLLSKVTLQPIARERVDVSALAEEIVAELRESEPERTVEVVIEPGIQTYADRGLLRVVLQNLLANAWKFTSRNPGASIEFGTLMNGNRSEIYVRDNGAGFDMTYASKLFTPFQRLHTTSDFSGTGIGLATVQRVIRRHGGVVRGEAQPGKGATFTFSMNGGA